MTGVGAPGGAGSRATRLAVAAALAFLALTALTSFLPGGGGQGGGSPSSSYSHRPDGASAWAELLRRHGRPVDRLRGDLVASDFGPRVTVVVLDAPGLTDREARHLARFVDSGGHLVAGGAGAGEWLEAILGRPPAGEPRGTPRAEPVGPLPAPEVEGVRTVRTAGRRSWRHPGQLRPILAGAGGRVIAAAGDAGRGRVVALADPSPVQNALLADEDNAALALGLVGTPERAVLFAEGVHGYGTGEGLAALPRRWRLVLAGLGLAAATWLLARSPRLGPPEDEIRPLPPPRWAYVDAVTGTLARTGRPGEAAEPVRVRARALIAARAGLPPDAGGEELRRAAVRFGLTPEEAETVAGETPIAGDSAVLAAGRALARLTGGPG